MSALSFCSPRKKKHQSNPPLSLTELPGLLDALHDIVRAEHERGTLLLLLLRGSSSRRSGSSRNGSSSRSVAAGHGRRCCIRHLVLALLSSLSLSLLGLCFLAQPRGTKRARSRKRRKRRRERGEKNGRKTRFFSFFACSIAEERSFRNEKKMKKKPMPERTRFFFLLLLPPNRFSC